MKLDVYLAMIALIMSLKTMELRDGAALFSVAEGVFCVLASLASLAFSAQFFFEELTLYWAELNLRQAVPGDTCEEIIYVDKFHYSKKLTICSLTEANVYASALDIC